MSKVFEYLPLSISSVVNDLMIPDVDRHMASLLNILSTINNFTISIFHAMKKMSKGSKVISTFMLRINRDQGLTGKESHPIQLCVNR